MLEQKSVGERISTVPGRTGVVFMSHESHLPYLIERESFNMSHIQLQYFSCQSMNLPFLYSFPCFTLNQLVTFVQIIFGTKKFNVFR